MIRLAAVVFLAAFVVAQEAGNRSPTHYADILAKANGGVKEAKDKALDMVSTVYDAARTGTDVGWLVMTALRKLRKKYKLPFGFALRFAAKLNGHGHWCGQYRIGPNNNPDTEEVQDKGDACCMAHDKCILDYWNEHATYLNNAAVCNRPFTDCLKACAADADHCGILPDEKPLEEN